MTRSEAIVVGRRVERWRRALGLPLLTDAERQRRRRAELPPEQRRDEWRRAQRAKRAREVSP